jgi:hypothetical protein
VQDRIQAYGRTTGNAKIDQIKALAKHPPAKAAKSTADQIKDLDRQADQLSQEANTLVAEEHRIVAEGNLRAKYPSIHNRRQAVPRLQEISDELDEISRRLGVINTTKNEINAGAAVSASTTVSTPELRAQVMQILRTEGDGIGKSNVPAPRQPKAGGQFGADSPAVHARRVEASSAAEDGRDWVSGLLDPKATTTGVAHDVDVKWIQARAFARRRSRGGKNHSVHLPRDRSKSVGIEGRSTSVHEYGHTVEYATGAEGMSVQFFNYRRAGGDMRTMKQWGFSWYNDPQRTNSDRFQDVMDSWAGDRASEFAHYTGKQYNGPTEILSMGMEAFYRDPIGFVTKDPEWANYIFGVLDGGFKP